MKLKKLQKKKNLTVIDDNCEALGSKWNNKVLGNQFDMCTWSFDIGKTITTGEGGMITTNKKKYFKYCLEYRDHGHENNPKFPKGRDTRKIYGFNYRVTELTGALGIIQLKKLDKVIINNRKRYKIYENILKKYPEINIRKVPNENIPLKDCIIFNFKNRKLTSLFLENKKEKL